RPSIKIPALPFFTADTIFKKMFPHWGVPYLIWIDNDKKVRFKTESYHANSKKITEFLKKEKVDMAEKEFKPGVFNSNNLFNSEINPTNNKPRFYSILTNCMPGVLVS